MALSPGPGSLRLGVPFNQEAVLADWTFRLVPWVSRSRKQLGRSLRRNCPEATFHRWRNVRPKGPGPDLGPPRQPGQKTHGFRARWYHPGPKVGPNLGGPGLLARKPKAPPGVSGAFPFKLFNSTRGGKRRGPKTPPWGSRRSASAIRGPPDSSAPVPRAGWRPNLGRIGVLTYRAIPQAGPDSLPRKSAWSVPPRRRAGPVKLPGQTGPESAENYSGTAGNFEPWWSAGRRARVGRYLARRYFGPRVQRGFCVREPSEVNYEVLG